MRGLGTSSSTDEIEVALLLKSCAAGGEYSTGENCIGAGRLPEGGIARGGDVATADSVGDGCGETGAAMAMGEGEGAG